MKEPASTAATILLLRSVCDASDAESRLKTASPADVIFVWSFKMQKDKRCFLQ